MNYNYLYIVIAIIVAIMIILSVLFLTRNNFQNNATKINGGGACDVAMNKIVYNELYTFTKDNFYYLKLGVISIPYNNKRNILDIISHKKELNTHRYNIEKFMEDAINDKYINHFSLLFIPIIYVNDIQNHIVEINVFNALFEYLFHMTVYKSLGFTNHAFISDNSMDSTKGHLDEDLLKYYACNKEFFFTNDINEKELYKNVFMKLVNLYFTEFNNFYTISNENVYMRVYNISDINDFTYVNIKNINTGHSKDKINYTEYITKLMENCYINNNYKSLLYGCSYINTTIKYNESDPKTFISLENYDEFINFMSKF